MATSGSYSFNLTRDDIITQALLRLKVIDIYTTPDTTQITNAAQVLNTMIKSWRSEQILKWMTEWSTIILLTPTIVVGTDSKNYVCIRNHTSATTNKPITGSDWTTYWIQNDSFGGGVAWASAQNYISSGQYNLPVEMVDIKKAFIRSVSTDTQLNIIQQDDYLGATSKASFGTPKNIFFDRDTAASRIWLNPQPDVTTVGSQVLHIEAIRKPQDFTASTDNADFGEEWLNALVKGLAFELAPQYDIPIQERQILMQEALMAKQIAREFDIEDPSIKAKSDQRNRNVV